MRKALLFCLALAGLAVGVVPGHAAKPAVDLRGKWNCVVGSGDCTFTVSKMNLTTGAFSGTAEGNGSAGTVQGDLDGLRLTMTFDFNTGFTPSTAQGTVNRAGTNMKGTLDYHSPAVPNASFDWSRIGAAAADPEPVRGKTIVIGNEGGTVRYRKPGTSAFVTLGKDRAIPTSSEIDTKRGIVELTSAASATKDQAAKFSGGVFQVGQTKGSPLTTAKLTEPLTCDRAARAAKTAKRKLFGSGKGSFRTLGKYGAATVRGTKWTVEDTCTTTKLTVTQGTVSFLDLVKHKTVSVTAGHSYTARAG